MWVGYDETSWVFERDLTCQALIQDYEEEVNRVNRLNTIHVSDE